MTGAPLTPEERARLARIADAMFPRTDEMPSASDVEVSGRLVDRVLHAVPSLAPGLRGALSAARAGPPEAALAELRERHPREARTLFLVLASAYYLAPEVQDRVGYHGQEARTIDVFELPGYLEDGSLERVIERGRRYVDVEDEGASA